ncbi:protein NLRC3-like [Centroberyx gerrardi]
MKTIMSLGKLAFEELEKGNLVFTEEDLTERGIDITATAVYSGLFTQISRDDRGLYKQKLFCFVHMSIQEFLAAVYVFLTFTNKGENVLIIPDSTVADLPASDFYKSAVDKALDNNNGDWDLFLRFLLGLSLETNQRPLQELLTKTENSSETNKNTENSSETYKKTTEYIKEKIRGELNNANKNINLFHCLNELNDHSLVEEIKQYLRSGSLAYENFSPSQWSALTFVLLTSDEKLDVFDLKKYLKSEQVLLGMLPVVKVSTTALLSWCDLSMEACAGLASSVLRSCSSNLTELDLSHNDLLDSGVELLSGGLKSLHCRLEILKLSGCQVTETGCASLASALNSRTSKLKQLDLSYNHPGDSGVTMLSDIAEDPHFSLETLSLDHGGERRLKPGLKKYGVDLILDENTASRRLVLSEGNRKAKTKQKVEEDVPYPDHPDRFNRTQVLCEEGLTGLCYWEVEWRGTVGIGVAYRGVNRRGWDRSCGLGCNEMSWSLNCSKKKYTAWHETPTSIKVSDPSQKIALFLDWEGGTLDYYSVSSGKLSHIHTFKAKFTEPLYPGFWFKKGSVSLCPIE